MHNDFTLFSRTVLSGKTVVYYYAYNDDGERMGPWTFIHSSSSTVTRKAGAYHGIEFVQGVRVYNGFSFPVMGDQRDGG